MLAGAHPPRRERAILVHERAQHLDQQRPELDRLAVPRAEFARRTPPTVDDSRLAGDAFCHIVSAFGLSVNELPAQTSIESTERNENTRGFGWHERRIGFEFVEQ
jgi:hypothetical protein